MGDARSIVSGKYARPLILVLSPNWYQEFDGMTARMRTTLEICLVVYPHGKVVNSVIVGKKRAQACDGSLDSARKSEEDCGAL